jgi:hypothetical protein
MQDLIVLFRLAPDYRSILKEQIAGAILGNQKTVSLLMPKPFHTPPLGRLSMPRQTRAECGARFPSRFADDAFN